MTTFDDPADPDVDDADAGSNNRTFLLVAGLLGGFVFLSLLCMVGYLIFANNANQQSETTAVALATQQAATIQAGITATAQMAAIPATFQAAEGQNITQSTTVGKIEIEYPIQMMPSESETVLVYVSVPAQLVNVDFETLTRVPVSAAGAIPAGMLNKFSTNILIAEQMRVVLSSPSFKVEELIQSTQPVKVDIGGWVTSWAWTIKAPQEYGTQVFTVRVYLLDNSVPAWFGSFNVNIVAPTSTPQPTSTATLIPSMTSTLTLTSTPIPPLAQVTKGLLDNPIGFLTVVVTLIGIILTYVVARNKDKKNNETKNSPPGRPSNKRNRNS
jgi:hypothetical protein